VIDNDHSTADPFGQIADEFVEAFRQGKRPSVEEFARRYPEHADEIRAMLPALVLMEKAKSPDETAGQPQGAAPMLRQLGDYEILGEVGRGGMGVVYEAQQLSLGRHVAIKVLPTHALLDARQLGRFHREARSAAKLHHTNIVPVFGVGEQDGLHYYVMQFIHGLGLDLVLDELRRLRHPRGKPAPTRDEPRGRSTPVLGDIAAVTVARGLVSGKFLSRDESTEEAASRQEKGRSAGASDSPPGPHASSRIPHASSLPLPGQSGASTLGESGGQYWQSVARVGIQVAEALAHAASQGVLHRDIKPSNLLLDDTGNVWVTDFGLAKADDGGNLTHTGDIVGTLRYMAPERFNGKGDLRSDVYSLGLTLYEMLVLRHAFDESDRHKLVKQVMHDEPVRPRKLNSGVPRDLETVVLKAIARDPAHRYQTPSEMADDLKCFLEDRPVRARRISEVERLWRWSRRNPTVAILGGALAVVLVAVTVASLLAAGHFNRLRWSEAQAAQKERHALAAESAQRERADGEAQIARNAERVASNLAQAEAVARKLAQQETLRAEAEKKRAEGQLARAEWLVYVGKLSLAQTDLETGNGGFVLRYLEECQWNLRGWEHRYLSTRISAKQIFLGHKGTIWSVTFSPDGKRIVTSSEDKTAKVWDAESGRELLALKGHTCPVRSVALSPDGNRILTGAGAPGLPGEAKVWDAATGQELHSLKGITNEVWTVAFGPDSKRIVTGAGNRLGSPGEAKVWDAMTGRELVALKGIAGCVGGVAFSPDGKRIVVGGWDIKVKVCDAATGQELRDLKGHAARVWTVAFSPDSKRIVTGSADQTARVWDAETGEELAIMKGHSGELRRVAFSPDGKRILTSSDDRTAKVWDSHTGLELFALKGHTAEVFATDFSPDGKRIVTGGDDRTVRMYDAEKGQTVLALKGHSGEIRGVAFSPDGQRIVTAGRGHSARVWDVHTGREILKLHAGEVSSVACSRNGQHIATAGKDQTARVWDAHTGREVLAIKGHPGAVASVAFSPDSKRLFTGSWQAAKVWDAQTGQECFDLQGHKSWVWGVAFSPDGKYIVTGGEDLRVKVWDAQSGQQLHSVKGHTGIVWSVAFSPDSQRFVSTSNDRTAVVWDAATGEEVFVLKGHTAAVYSAAFSPDGKRIVTGAGDPYRQGETKLWDAATGQEVLTLAGHTAQVRSVAFSPDGKRLVTGSADRTAIIWAADRDQEFPALAGHTGKVTCLSFSADGKRIVTGSADHTVKVWDVAKGQELLTLKGHQHTLAIVAFSADGKRVFTWDRFKTELAWSAADGMPIALADPPLPPWPGPARSPDGLLRAVPQGNTIVVADTSPLAVRLPVVLRGQDEPTNNAERVAFAQLAHDRRQFALASRLWSEALASDPTLGDDRQAQHRYHAARAATLAAAAQSKEKPPLDDAAKAQLRRQAHDWLKAELAAWDKHIKSGPSADRRMIVLQLTDWTHDNDLATIRDTAALSQLRAEEQKAFNQLWADVAQVKKIAWGKFGSYLKKQLPSARKAYANDGPELAYLLTHIGMGLLMQEQWTAAEPFIRECLAIRAKAEPDWWATFHVQSMLGGALLGQKKYTEAEPLLLAGYAGMKERANTIAPMEQDRLNEAVERLVQLYEATGKHHEVARWQRELAALETSRQQVKQER
jgi:WD40 repeat protein/serine/threonine protein kinase